MKNIETLNQELRSLNSSSQADRLRDKFNSLIKEKFGYSNVTVKFWSSSDHTVEEKEIPFHKLFSHMVDWVLFRKGVHDYKPEIEGLDFYNLDTLLNNGMNFSLNMSMELFENGKSLRII